MMKMWLLLFAFLAPSVRFAESKHKTTTAPPQPSVCPELPLGCKCYREKHMLNVQCDRVQDVESFVKPLMLYYRTESINIISLWDVDIPDIPAKAFGNLTIRELSLNKGRIGNISDQAFVEIVEFGVMIWKNISGFNTVPNAVVSTNFYRLEFLHGDLTSVGTQLQNMTNLKILDFSFNKIESIDPEAFKNCLSLRKLVLSNNMIKNLDEGLFRTLAYLFELHLDSNKLVSLANVLKPPARALQILNLKNNSFSNVSSMFTFQMPALKSLDLSFNPLQTLTASDFQEKFLKMNLLRLDNTSLSEIGKNTFSSISEILQLFLRNNSLTKLPEKWLPRSVHEVYLDNNFFTNVSGSFHFQDNFFMLSLTNNRIKDIEGVFDYMPRLTKLLLSHNLIESLPRNGFTSFPFLEKLYIDYNRITGLNAESFAGLSSRLQMLDLSSNELEDLNGAFVKTLHKVQELRLPNNKLQVLSPEDLDLAGVSKLDLSGNNISSLNGAFAQLKNLAYLDLRNNYVMTIEEQNFPEPIELKEIELSGNPVCCDCRLLWLVETFRNKSRHQIGVDSNATCASPPWLSGTPIHQLYPPVIIEWKQNCPSECRSCKCYPTQGKINVYVDCHGRNLTSIPRLYPSQTSSLNLSDNLLKNLPEELPRMIPNLENLDLSENLLEAFDHVSFPPGLKVLNLARNKFAVFPRNVFLNIKPTDVEVSNNPWLCNCDAKPFWKWLQINTHIVGDINETRCSNGSTNGGLAGRQISNLTELDLCPVALAMYIIIIIAVMGVLLSASGAFIGYIRYQMPIKVWLYTKGLCLRWVKEEDLDEDKEYDAFVAFSNNDLPCVKEMVKELERKPPFFKLCIHSRDFLGGAYILESIIRAVRTSKKTVILLSKSFLESEWTMKEFRQAHHQTMEEKINRIIFVLVGGLPTLDNIDEDVRGYLTATTYLRWEDKYFWQKLRYAMPKHAVPREINLENVEDFNVNEASPLLQAP